MYVYVYKGGDFHNNTLSVCFTHHQEATYDPGVIDKEI
jgi:hypothetical protein